MPAGPEPLKLAKSIASLNALVEIINQAERAPAPLLDSKQENIDG